MADSNDRRYPENGRDNAGSRSRPSSARRRAARQNPQRGWLTLVALVLCVVGLIIILTSMLVGVLNGGPSGNAGSDPMFAEPAEGVTRPPSLDGEDGASGDMAEDPSQNWHYETLTPLTPDGYAAT